MSPPSNPDRRDFIRTSLAITSAALLPGLDGCSSGARGSPPPNLVFVFPDQMRGQALGFLGEDPVVTPYLDRFAEESAVLPRAVSNYPVCSPYRAMMLTGMYPHANGVLGNCNTNGAEHGYELQTDARCWSDVLKDNGYKLGYIGKWHLDSPRRPYVDTSNNTQDFAWNEWTPPQRRHGFDFWYAYGTYDNHNRPEYWTTSAPRSDRIAVDQWSPEHEADMAVRYIRNEGQGMRDPGRPFALVVSMNPPHMPYQMVPEEYLEPYRGRSIEDLVRRSNVNLDGSTEGGRLARRHLANYFAQITGVDHQFGRILDALRDAGLEEDTLVVFTSDHGNCLGAHEEVSKNVHFEESMRVPFLIRWPGKIRPGKDPLLLSVPDLHPTLLDLMGLGRQISASVQGESRASLLRDRTGVRPTSQLYMWTPYGEPALGRRGVRTHRHTLVLSKDRGGATDTVLHDNVADPSQLENVASAQPGLVRELEEEELLPWLEQTGDPWIES
ncbi:sulfatase [Gemmatimonadota bacterium]